MAVPPSRQAPRRRMNELHFAARDGSTERTIALLSRGEIDIDLGNQDGATPLMLSAIFGHSRVAKILLNKGANVSLANDEEGFTALHFSAHRGHLAVTKLLVKAKAGLEAKVSCSGCTPLHMAVENGHLETMRVLIEAGANANSRALGEATPLYMAAESGHAAAVSVLLRAKANPLLASTHPSGGTLLPLDVAAKDGHSEVARELLRELGVKGCGGTSDGVQALQMAAQRQHVEIMGMLTDAGVVDPGVALIAAAMCGREFSVKFLLQQEEQKASCRKAAYLDILNRFGATPLLSSIEACRSCSPRIARLLIDAGADTATAFRLTDVRGVVVFDGTPLAFTNLNIRQKKIKGKDATEEQLHSLEAIRRLLLRVEAVHAVSWLWANNAPSSTHAASEEASRNATTSTAVASMLPILRRRAGRPRVLLAAVFRNSTKP